MVLKRNTLMNKLQIITNRKKNILVVNPSFPIDYDTFTIDLLDSLGNETEMDISIKKARNNRIELQFVERVEGIFQLRIRDKNSYLVQKVIIQ